MEENITIKQSNYILRNNSAYKPFIVNKFKNILSTSYKLNKNNDDK